MVKKVHRSVRGKAIDFDALLLKNEKSVAIGNASMNARGDRLGRGGKVLEKGESPLSPAKPKVENRKNMSIKSDMEDMRARRLQWKTWEDEDQGIPVQEGEEEKILTPQEAIAQVDAAINKQPEAKADEKKEEPKAEEKKPEADPKAASQAKRKVVDSDE